MVPSPKTFTEQIRSFTVKESHIGSAVSKIMYYTHSHTHIHTHSLTQTQTLNEIHTYILFFKIYFNHFILFLWILFSKSFKILWARPEKIRRLWPDVGPTNKPEIVLYSSHRGRFESYQNSILRAKTISNNIYYEKGIKVYIAELISSCQ